MRKLFKGGNNMRIYGMYLLLKFDDITSLLLLQFTINAEFHSHCGVSCTGLYGIIDGLHWIKFRIHLFFQNVKNVNLVTKNARKIKLDHATNQMVNVNAVQPPPLPSTKLLYCSPHSWFSFHTKIENKKLIWKYVIRTHQ